MTSNTTAKGTPQNAPERDAQAGFADADAANSDWLKAAPEAPAPDSPAADGHLVMTLTARGDIRSVSDEPGGGLPEVRAGQALAECWPESLTTFVTEHCQRTLRGRRVRHARSSIDEIDRDYEFTFVPQGRDAVMVIVRDVTARERQVAELEQLAFGDRATGLPNRAWLVRELDSALARRRLQSGRVAVIVLEIGNLELIEQITGRRHRDTILLELGARMRAGLRGANQNEESDDERYSAVARVGTHHFAILLPYIETGEDAAGVTARVTELLEAPLEIADKAASVSVAAGIALYPQDGKSGAELYECAVMALHDAKNSETRRQRFHSGTVRLRALERQDLEVELRSALENDEFTLNYLPIVATGDRRIATAEALLRWPQPLFGNKPIREVVAVAEFTGLILPIGDWVFARACEQLAEWRGRGHEDLGIAVNVSAQEFAQADLVARTEQALETAGIDAGNVAVEITERLLYRDSLSDYAVCHGLRDLGVGVTVDDYGTGVCSFDHLSRSPVNAVKIHPDIVARAARGGAGGAACAAVTAMAHALDIVVVAVGRGTQQEVLDAFARVFSGSRIMLQAIANAQHGA
ncbi:MAG: EAL domain-containing protein, partial [Woeseiaceae bacterium]|nr:EAL domain-containing protein [Woeseiaceae bacterium]